MMDNNRCSKNYRKEKKLKWASKHKSSKLIRVTKARDNFRINISIRMAMKRIWKTKWMILHLLTQIWSTMTVDTTHLGKNIDDLRVLELKRNIQFR